MNLDNNKTSEIILLCPEFKVKLKQVYQEVKKLLVLSLKKKKIKEENAPQKCWA